MLYSLAVDVLKVLLTGIVLLWVAATFFALVVGILGGSSPGRPPTNAQEAALQGKGWCSLCSAEKCDPVVHKEKEAAYDARFAPPKIMCPLCQCEEGTCDPDVHEEHVRARSIRLRGADGRFL